jgi:beta-N-acetylhexosaminidase
MTSKDISSVGDHFLVGLRPSVALDEHDRALLRDLRPAGVVLFKSNFLHGVPYEQWLEAHTRLIEDVRCAVGRERLLIAIDHEGGRVCRTPAPITRFSYAARWAGEASAVGRAMGRELASLGINLSFAPVLDIHSNPLNPVIGLRAFGTTSEVVSQAALDYLRALQSQGVIACGKHFPGHGDTAQDSHRELPVLRQDLEALRGRELQPFLAAIRAGISMLMTSHILLPQVDAQEPVTLSARFNQQLLRDELGFAGVIVSDDIGMHAMSERFRDPTAAVRFVKAGADIITVCSFFTDTDRCRELAEALLGAYGSGEITPECPSRARIQALLARAAQHPVIALPPQVFEEHQRAAALFAAETAEVI